MNNRHKNSTCKPLKSTKRVFLKKRILSSADLPKAKTQGGAKPRNFAEGGKARKASSGDC
jgi:hypothetical protein